MYAVHSYSISRILNIETGKLVSFSNEDCNFGYRNSIFKNEQKGKVILTSVSFKLTKSNHNLNTSYGAIETELASKKIKNPTLKNISDAVIAIRKSKLPDPKEMGNGGSFFKNPVISKTQFETLQKKYATIAPPIPIRFMLFYALFKLGTAAYFRTIYPTRLSAKPASTKKWLRHRGLY